MKKVKVNQKVLVFAAFPEKGAYYSGAEGKVVQKYWQEKEEVIDNFVTVKLEGSGDLIPVHIKQLRKIHKNL